MNITAKRPVIGITPTFDADRESYRLYGGYSEMVYLSGGEPVLLPYEFEKVGILGGLLLSGGGDFAPSPGLGGYPAGPTLDCVEPRRDDAEARLYRAARELGLPILGVCRGCQLINLMQGGTLHRDLAEAGYAEPHSIPGGGTHPVRCSPGSLAERMLGQNGGVISTHHQAVNAPGRGLTVTALSPAGVVECIEHEDGRLLGLQTHPERMRLAAPFEWLVGLTK